MPALQRSEKSVFLEAIEIRSAADQAFFSTRSCAGNPALRAEVEALSRPTTVRAAGWISPPPPFRQPARSPPSPSLFRP